MKRLFLLFFSALLCTAVSAHDFVVDGIFYDITSSSELTVAVTYGGSRYDSYSNEYSGSVFIPEKVTYHSNEYSVTSIGSGAFYECSGLTSVTIPNSVTSIGSYAFSGCYGLTSVTIGNSVTSIGEEAFYYCSRLTSVTIGNSVTSIGESAFANCSGLTSVTIPNSVTSIGESAFRDCSGLTSVTIGNSVTSIGEIAFKGCSALTAVHITDLSAWCKIQFVKNDIYGDFSNPTYYAHHLYLNGEEITNLVIPNDVTSIGYAAFIGCSGLTSVTIPNSVTSIGTYAFADCYGLTSVTIPESCKIVPQYAFEWCINLQELTLPSTCIACYDYSFNECSSLKKINCQAETPPAVYKNTFSSSIYTKATLNVPEGSVEKYKVANIWKEFTNMTTGGSELKQCAAPVITYADGKLQFACETAGAECKYTLTAKDIQTAFITASNNSVDLTACYDITAYAVAEGYKNSEKVTATLYWINGSDVSTNINQTEMRGVIATCSGGIITVSGLTDGETVMFYDANGALLYTGTAQNGTVSYAPSTSGVIIVKIGTTSIKVVN